MKSMLSYKLEAQLTTFFLLRYKAVVISYDEGSDIFVSEGAFMMGETMDNILKKLPVNDVRYIIMKFHFQSFVRQRNDSLILEWDPDVTLSAEEKRVRADTLKRLMHANKSAFTHLTISSFDDFEESNLLYKLDSLNQVNISFSEQ